MNRKDTLSRREREIMDVLHELGDEASADDIRSRLSDPPTYSAVRAMLTKLEAKGAIRHKEKGLRYIYSPTTTRTAARRTALQRLVRVFFAGSRGDAVSALLDAEEWSEDELAEMGRLIERKKKDRNK